MQAGWYFRLALNYDDKFFNYNLYPAALLRAHQASALLRICPLMTRFKVDDRHFTQPSGHDKRRRRKLAVPSIPTRRSTHAEMLDYARWLILIRYDFSNR